tara:strand:- start:2368 stop:2961 length:594 start_codon:yes stop_codon:yes gene_type:complete
MADKIQALVGNNPMIKSVMSNPEHMAKAQEMLRNPEMQKQIGGVISNPAVIKQASEVLNGLQQMNTIQAGGRKRRRTKKKRRRRRKRTKKKRRKKSRRRRNRGGQLGNFRNRLGRSGDTADGEKCTRKWSGSQCKPGSICQGGFCTPKKDSTFFYRTGKTYDTFQKYRPRGPSMKNLGWAMTGGRNKRRTRKRRRRR